MLRSFGFLKFFSYRSTFIWLSTYNFQIVNPKAIEIFIMFIIPVLRVLEVRIIISKF